MAPGGRLRDAPLPPPPFPDVRVVPGRAPQRDRARRSSTRRRSVACSSRFLVLGGIDPTVANVIQALIYTLATRVGAPGRDRYMLVLVLLIGLVSGWVTAQDGRDRGGLHRPRRHPGRGLPRHRPRRPGRPARRGVRGHREEAADPGGLADRRRSGPGRERSVSATVGPHRPGVARAGRGPATADAPRRRPPSTSTSRSASRSARTATSSSWPAPSSRGPATGSPRSLEAVRDRDRPPRRSLDDARFGPPGSTLAGPRSARCTSAAGRRRSCRQTTWPALIELVRRALRARRGCRGHARGEPGPGRAGRSGRPAPGRRHPALDRRPEPRRRRAPPARPAPSRRTDVGDAVAAARAAGHRLGQPRPPLRRARPDDRRLDVDPRGGARPAPDHLSLYALTLDDPDEEGLTGPDGDHLPTSAGARRWRDRARPAQDEDRAAAMYHHAVGPPSRGRLARLRDQQLGPARPREPPQPRLLGAAAVRGGRARRARLRRRDPPLERRPPRPATSRPSLPTVGRSRAPAGRQRGPRPGDGRRRGGHPRPPHSTTAWPRRRPPPAVRRAAALGPRRGARRRRRRRPPPPDDPRPAPLERALRPPRLTAHRTVRRSGRRALTLHHTGCYDAPTDS